MPKRQCIILYIRYAESVLRTESTDQVLGSANYSDRNERSVTASQGCCLSDLTTTLPRGLRLTESTKDRDLPTTRFNHQLFAIVQPRTCTSGASSPRKTTIYPILYLSPYPWTPSVPITMADPPPAPDDIRATADGTSDPNANIRYVLSGQPTGWAAVAASVREYDEDRIKSTKEDIDTLLVFAGLFSAVLTAFLIESYQRLLPDTAAQTSSQMLSVL
ncbi:hypothetical protein BC629DRAFT_442168 [Irpex lacteus]|nr:hypothetical protein BC629DRAFT_442168 [Irpex lacteus]